MLLIMLNNLSRICSVIKCCSLGCLMTIRLVKCCIYILHTWKNRIIIYWLYWS
eukprot:UN00506